MGKPRLVYIAGSYRAPTPLMRAGNIRRATETGKRVAKAGAYPVIPHRNTGDFDAVVNDDRFWVDGTLELMRACHAVMLVEGDHQRDYSLGTQVEILEAKRMGLPVFETIDQLAAWVRYG